MQKLLSSVRVCLDHYNMIEDGDKIAVGISGGKDSVVLLCALAELRRFYPKTFTLEAITIDPQFNNEPCDYSQINELCKRLKVNYTVKRTELYEIIFNIRKESNPCSLCSKMRKGALNDIATELGCNKVALGHHLDDAVETFYMNLFFGGNIGSFQPVNYLSRKNIHLIRPLALINERDIAHIAKKYNLPIITSNCTENGFTERENIKKLVRDLEKTYPDLRKKTLGAMQRSHITGW